MLSAPIPLTTTGIVMPADFPVAEYEAVYARVRDKHSGADGFRHFGGAFNALSYRFRAAHDIAVQFQQNFKHQGSSPPPEPRYEQERLLFDFYSSCFSVVEAYFFALFAVGHLLKPSDFPLATPDDEQKVSPTTTLKKLGTHFAGDPIITALTTVTQSDDYKELRVARNILTHRTAPGRLMYVSVGEDDAPPTEWKLDGQPITDYLLVLRKAQLAALFKVAMVELDKFTKAHITQDMPKNFLKVPAHILARLKSFGQDDVVVACVKLVTADDVVKYRHLGLSLANGELVAPARQLPSPGAGKYSQANVLGWEKVRRDLPKEKRSFGFWAPNYGDWSRGSHYVSHEREVYPREFYPPKEVELSITSVGTVAGGHKVRFAVEQVINQRTPNFEQELLYNLNILQENVGAADVFPSEATMEEYARTVRVDWQLLPPGTTDEVMERLLKGKGTLAPDAERTMRERVDFIGRLKPEAFIAGTDGFLRYFGAKFGDDLVAFENARYGNALYVMYEDWEAISRRSRIDLLSGPPEGFQRVEHRKGWTDILRAIVNEYRRKQRSSNLL